MAPLKEYENKIYALEDLLTKTQGRLEIVKKNQTLKGSHLMMLHWGLC